jgi:hypothetical protein
VSDLLGGAVAVIRTALAGVRDAQPLYLSAQAKADLLRDLVEVEAQVAELRLRVLGVAQDLAVRDGAHDTGAWFAAAVPVDAAVARAEVRLARSLETWPRVALALREGRLTLAQAHVIVRCLDDVADALTADQRAEAEALMLAEAKSLDPRRLRLLGRRLQALVGRDNAEAAEALLLRAEEQAAVQRTSLSITPQGDGTTRITGTVADAVGARLKMCLEAFAQPRKQALAADGRRVRYDRLLGQALGDLLERIDPADLPWHGGDATTMFVTVTLDQLRAELATAELGFGGERITAAEARRLACAAAVIPVVLGGHGEILDVGRASRLHTPVMRKAIRLRDRTCRAEGCDVPAPWCDVHHPHRWLHGGVTSVDNGVLLCAHHHQRIHDPAYHPERRPDGRYRIVRRT